MKNKIGCYIKNHEILSFVFFTFLCSWIIWGVLYSSYIGIIDSSFYKRYMVVFICSGAYMPSILSVIFTGFLYKKKGIRGLLHRLVEWKYNPIYYIFAIFYCIVLAYSTYLICKYLGYNGKIMLITDPYFIFGNFIFVLLLGGPLNEEIGWRGFLLPRLQRYLNPFWSSVVMGIIWACWHLPMFFIVGTGQYGYPFILFMLDTTLASIFITWIFNRTNGSLIFPILFHAWNNVFNGLIIGKDNFFVGPKEYIYYAIQIIVIIFVVCNMLNKKTTPYTIEKI